MANYKLIFLFAAFLVLCVSGISAEPIYNFELSDSLLYSEETANWSIDISAPKINGMSDPAEQQELNRHFITKAGEILAEYQESVSRAAESIHEGNSPNFIYQYYYEAVPSCDEFFTFRTVTLYRSSSAEFSGEYWTLDRRTGQLLDFSDIVKTPEEMAAIREQISMDMKNRNDEIGAPVYRTEDDSLDKALEHVGEKQHWYFNEDRDLVIVFDKFEIAPGIVGSPEFPVRYRSFFDSGS